MFSGEYLRNKSIEKVQWRPGDSHFWSGLMKVRDKLLSFGTFCLNNGTKSGSGKIDVLVILLLNTSTHPCITQYDRNKHQQQRPLVILLMCPFAGHSRGIISLSGMNWQREKHQYNLMINQIPREALVQLNDQLDPFTGLLTKTGLFTVSSMYSAMLNDNIASCTHFPWNLSQL